MTPDIQELKRLAEALSGPHEIKMSVPSDTILALIEIAEAADGLERAAFNAGYCYGVENDASPEELDCAWELYCRDRREQVRTALEGVKK